MTGTGAGKLSFTGSGCLQPFSLCVDRAERLVSVRFVRWCNGNTAPFGGVIHGSNPCRTAKSIYFSSSDSHTTSHVSVPLTESLRPFAPVERFNQTIRILMSAGDTPEMRAA